MHDIVENLCIRVPKVYDWVKRQVDLPLLSYTNVRDLGFDCEGATGSNDDPCAVLEDPFNVEVLLTNEFGEPTKDVEVSEIKQPHGRTPVEVTLPNGDTITLYKVKVLVKGFFTVEITDRMGHVCVSDAKPFATAQTFFLCAPKGTKLNGKVTTIDGEIGDASLICVGGRFAQLDVSISFCLDVQMEAEVKIEVEGRFCTPRSELPINSCDTVHIPPQCPELFPAHQSDDDFC